MLEQLLGLAYKGVVGSDFFNAYRKFAKDHPDCLPAYCWAHLIREVRYLTTLGDKATSTGRTSSWIGSSGYLRLTTPRGVGPRPRPKRRSLSNVHRPPKRAEAVKLAGRVKQQKQGYFLFLAHEGVDPTNNVAEPALRHGVMHRKLTQGTRGETGRRWFERMPSVRATCRQQGRSFFDYLVQAIEAYTTKRPPPELIA